jgi:hypothetical protein
MEKAIKRDSEGADGNQRILGEEGFSIRLSWPFRVI